MDFGPQLPTVTQFLQQIGSWRHGISHFPHLMGRCRFYVTKNIRADLHSERRSERMMFIKYAHCVPCQCCFWVAVSFDVCWTNAWPWDIMKISRKVKRDELVTLTSRMHSNWRARHFFFQTHGKENSFQRIMCHSFACQGTNVRLEL